MLAFAICSEKWEIMSIEAVDEALLDLRRRVSDCGIPRDLEERFNDE